jgi:hypothetical protein
MHLSIRVNPRLETDSCDRNRDPRLMNGRDMTPLVLLLPADTDGFPRVAKADVQMGGRDWIDTG